MLKRIEEGSLRPSTPFELSHAILTALTNNMETFVESLTEEIWRLEQQVTTGHTTDSESFLEELFRARHGLLAIRTIAVLSREIYGRTTTLACAIPPDWRPLAEDIVNQRTDFPHLAVVLAIMATISVLLLWWAKRRGWW